MSTMLAPQSNTVQSDFTPTPTKAISFGKRWLFGPWADMFLVANIAWPLLVLLARWGNPLVDGPLTFVQVYFLSTPHRWITLALVFFDREKFKQQPGRFIGVGVSLVLLGLVLAAVGGYWPKAVNSLVPLMMLDFIWNAWHFAAQHAGISRIYARHSSIQQPDKEVEFEKSAIRLLVLWVFFRLAMYRGQHQPEFSAFSLPTVMPFLDWFDPFAVAGIAVVLGKELFRRPFAHGRVLYLGNMTVLYVLQLVAIRLQAGTWMTALFLGGAVFHAVEYLAIVSWSVRKKTTGIWRHLAPRLGVSMLVFMAVLMISNYLLARQSFYVWSLITLLVSLLHYGYDGMIWKSRPAAKKPTTAVA